MGRTIYEEPTFVDKFLSLWGFMKDRLNTESDMYPCSLSAHAATTCHPLLASRTLKFLK